MKSGPVSGPYLDGVHGIFSSRTKPKPRWYDPETDQSQFMAALWKVRHLCTRAEHVRMTVPGTRTGDHVGGPVRAHERTSSAWLVMQISSEPLRSALMPLTP
jgi:hypothetical protein